MSDSQDGRPSIDSMEIVRLKVDGASTTVNTIREQQTARGLSLVCPFPALEVDIPVEFGARDEEQKHVGSIHRIGVEDDPETGLPRLRLSIRTADLRGTVVTAPSSELIAEASRATPAPDARAETDFDLAAESICEEATGEHVMGETELDEDEANDPAWVGCDEMPLPEELMAGMRTRRRGRMAGVVAWFLVLGLGAGAVYLLDRAGVVDTSSIGGWAEGLIQSSTSPATDSLAGLLRSDEAAPAEQSAIADLAADATGDDQSNVEDFELGVSEFAETGQAPAVELGEVAALVEEKVLAAAPVEAANDKKVVESADDVTLMLPTRWPAEYASAYRLRNPNGVVVDVPGGLVKREGWLEVGASHPMIRSVKAMQRETGARFVVFIHGELPRFMTAPKTGGIALRLVRDAAEQPGETAQVAVLEQ